MAEPLARDGLLAQIFQWAQQWQNSLTQQWTLLTENWLGSGQIPVWWSSLLRQADVRLATEHAALAVILILMVAAAAQWLLQRALRSSQRQLAHWARQHTGTTIPDAVDTARGFVTPYDTATRLRRLPLVITSLALASLPWILALGVLAMSQAPLNHRVGPTAALLLFPLGEAWAVAALLALALRALVAAHASELRLLRLHDDTALTLDALGRLLISVTVVGLGLGEVLQVLGAPLSLITLVTKLAGLLALLIVIVTIWHTRKSVQAWLLSAPVESPGTALRHWLASRYLLGALILATAFWFIWAFSLSDGLQHALRFVLSTLLVLIASRVLWILLLGFIDRWQAQLTPWFAALPSQHVVRYRRWLRGLAHGLVGILTLLALLLVWGIPLDTTLSPGSLGRRLVAALVTIVVAVLLAILVWEALALAIQRRVQAWARQGDTQRAARLQTLAPILRLLLLVGIGLVVLLTVLSELGVNTTPLLAGASIFGLAIGFGSQKLVQDFMTGLFLLLENSMQVGDWVSLGGVSGTVESLSLRTVRLRASDGSVYLVPYSAVTTVNNLNRGLGMASVRLTLAAGVDPEPVFQLLRNVGHDLRQDPAWQGFTQGELEILGIEQMSGSSQTIAAQIATTDVARGKVQRELNQRVLAALRQAGLELITVR